jgi:hypothetical protein
MARLGLAAEGPGAEGLAKKGRQVMEVEMQ